MSALTSYIFICLFAFVISILITRVLYRYYRYSPYMRSLRFKLLKSTWYFEMLIPIILLVWCLIFSFVLWLCVGIACLVFYFL